MEEPQRKVVEPCTVAVIEHAGSYSGIGRVYHQLYGWARKHGVAVTGQPFTVFVAAPGEMDWESGRFEVCLPVAEGTAGADEVGVRTLPATVVLAAVVEGPYSEIPAHYAEFLAWIGYAGADITGPPREIYLVHPGPDGAGDPATFRTELQFPVADS